MNWADFVFDKNYSLMSLSDIEKYITHNKHLPNILPAHKIAKEGINLGENVIKQLQKIEELTLYIIQQNKEIKSLSSRIHRLEKNTPLKN